MPILPPRKPNPRIIRYAESTMSRLFSNAFDFAERVNTGRDPDAARIRIGLSGVPCTARERRHPCEYIPSCNTISSPGFNLFAIASNSSSQDSVADGKISKVSAKPAWDSRCKSRMDSRPDRNRTGHAFIDESFLNSGDFRMD